MPSTTLRALLASLTLVASAGLLGALAQGDNGAATETTTETSTETSTETRTEVSGTVAIAESDQGAHLVDGQGRSLYLHTADTEGEIACTGACTERWLPLTVQSADEATAGEGVDAAMLGTTERPDGTLQVTYGGHPLYRYAFDEEAGDAYGQSLGQAFFLVSDEGAPAAELADAEGDADEEAEGEVADEAQTEVDPALLPAMEQGGRLFASSCAVCHGDEGQGAIGPRLAGNSNLQRGEFVATRVVHGFPDHGMPPFGGQFDDEQVAAVVTFVRNAWENDFGAFPAAEVEDVR